MQYGSLYAFWHCPRCFYSVTVTGSLDAAVEAFLCAVDRHIEDECYSDVQAPPDPA